MNNLLRERAGFLFFPVHGYNNYMEDRNALENLKQKVLSQQKVLGEIYHAYKTDSIYDYANSWKVKNSAFQFSENPLLVKAANLLEKKYSSLESENFLQQLKQSPLVSTIDHHGILNHPFFINSNLIFSQRENMKALICFTTSGISLNNSSWPASLVLTETKTGKLKRFSFFSDKLKTRAVFAAPALTEESESKVLKQISRDLELSAREKDLLLSLVKEMFEIPGIFNKDNFSDQACVISSWLWRKIFPPAPPVYYLPIEDLAAKVLLENILNDSGHVLYQLLFEPSGWILVEKYFNGALGAFSSGHKGSFLFWGVDDSGRRLRLARSGGKLIGENFSISLDSRSVGQALKARKIYPSTLLCFLITLHYQVTCLGGFNQVNWLTGIKEKFISLLKEIGKADEAGQIDKITTDNFAEASLAFAAKEGKIIKATGLDILLSQQDHWYYKYKKLARQINIGESIETQLPEIYKVITPEAERDYDLLNLTEEEIAEQNSVADKIRQNL